MNRRDVAHIPKSMLFQWHVTDRCNLRCSHCYQDTPATPDPSWEELMPILEQFRSFIISCRNSDAGQSFRAHVTVTGGEPFLREDFPLLLERLSGERQLFSFAILTNGTLLTPAAVRLLRRLRPSFVQVSIDGTRETHDRIRGEMSHDRAVAGVKLLVGAGIPAYLSFTAQRSNYRDFPAVARLGRRLGAARVWSDRMVPCGREHLAEEALMTPDETREFIGLMERERQRGWFRRSPVVLHRSLQFTATGMSPYRCSAGDTLVTVLPNGDVCPCRRMPVVAGNLHRQPLEYLYRNSELFRGLRDRSRLSTGCESCFYARSCGGGARCIARAVHGDPYRADPGCWLAADAVTSIPT
ncbi:MAG: radical SAM protein [Geobacteraceae bacterium]|nr:radical SAM protein [Geobacteraceae bacterium]